MAESELKGLAVELLKFITALQLLEAINVDSNERRSILSDIRIDDITYS